MRKFNIHCLYLIVVLCLFTAARTGAQTIQTVAGGGPNNVPAVDANLPYPTGVATDVAGNTYIADPNANRVYKVDTSGKLTVVAGSGAFGYSGDGGPAANATLSLPYGVALDSAGNVYIADTFNHRIRKVDTSGNISTVAGNGFAGFTGDGGAATSAELDNPYGVAVDSAGNLYIADQANQRIRRVDTSGIITTVAGNGSGGYSGDGGPATSSSLYYPSDIAVDSAGNLYIADRLNQRIRKVDASTHDISTVAGNGTVGYSGDGGLATGASLHLPYGVALDSSGNLYIADEGNHSIRKVDTSGVITTVAGNGAYGYSGDGGPATSAGLNSPSGVAVDSAGKLYIADQGNLRIRRVDTSGVIVTVAGNGTYGYSGDGGSATSAGLNSPDGVAVDGTGNLYIAEYSNNRVRKVDTSGNISTVAGNGTAGFSGDGGLATSAELNGPEKLAVDGAGGLYIPDVNNSRIRKVDTSGHISTVAGNGTYGYSGDGGPATSAELSNPGGVAVDSAGNLYIADFNNNRIRKVDTSGIITTVAGNGTAGFSGDGGPATSAELDQPVDVAVDSAGNLYIVDSANLRIRKVDASTHAISTVAGGSYGYGGDGGPATSARFFHPTGVAVDSTGNIYIADLEGQRIRKVDKSGIITTVAGNGSDGFSGDGGPATSAMLAYPNRVAVDGSGNLYISDNGNQRVRKVTFAASAPAVSLSPSSLDFGHSPLGVETGSQDVTVKNSGSAPLNINTVSVTGDFLETDTCNSQQIAAGDSCTVTVSFLPTATGTRNGTLTIADDAGDSPQSLNLTGVGDPAAPSISITAPSITYGADGSVTVTLTSSAGTVTGNVSLSVDGGTPIVQTLSSGSSVFTITKPTAGDHSLSASYAAQGNFAAVSGAGTLHVDQAGQIITFGALPGKTYGDADFSLTATASSGLAVSFSASGNCTVSASTVHITGAGSCTITASQVGDTNFGAAADVLQTFSIAKASATVTLSSLTQTYNGTALSPTATTTPSGLTIDWTGAPDTYANTYSVTATVNDPNYEGSVSGTFTINKAPSTTTFTSSAPSQLAYNRTYTVSAQTTGDGTLTIGASGACSISGNTVTITAGSGTCTVTATTVDGNNYIGSSATPQTIMAIKATATVTLGNLTQTYTGATLSPTATTSPAGLTLVWTNAPQTNVGSYAVTATINDPNYQGSATGTFVIQYGFSGLFAPYAPPTAGVAYKVPSTIPLKWQYTDATGNVVASPNAAPTVQIFAMGACGGSDSTVITLSDAGNSGYQYDSTTNTWQFNWKTTGLTSGCYDIYIQSSQSGQSNGGFPIQLK